MNDEKKESSPSKMSKSHHYFQPWIVVIAALIGIFVLVEGGLFIVVTTFIDPYIAALNEPKFNELENSFEEIIEHTLHRGVGRA